jgi:hypothetical protein
MFPKTGKKFQTCSRAEYAGLIADILRKELGGSHQAHKTLMRWTGANQRSARNWLSGSHGPSGEHLLHLMQHSDRVFECVLRLSNRRAVLCDDKLSHVRNTLQQTAELLSGIIEEDARRRHKEPPAQS